MTIYAMIFGGVFCVQLGRGEGRGFWHLVMTTAGFGTLGCAAAMVLS